MKSENRRVSGWLLVMASFILILIAYRVLSSWNDEKRLIVTKPKMEVSRTGMMATANQHATKAGIEILKKGGNAVDAAVAAAFALGVVEPFASGIGGGGFMVIYMAKDRQIITIDYRETAPIKAGPGIAGSFTGKDAADRSGSHRSAGVPGTVAGLALALKRYGTMDLKSVMGPAIRLAEDGYEVGQLLNKMMKNHFQKLSGHPATAGIFLKDGLPYEVGDKLQMKDLAAVYLMIAERGPDVFYKGQIAEAVEREMKAAGGLISLKDLAGYQPVLRAPVSGNYRGYEIFSMGPPSSGGTHVIQLLNILEGYDVAGMGLNSTEGISIMAQAMKKIFSDRSRFMGDPDFVKVPVKDLISKEYAGQSRQKIKTGAIKKEGPGNQQAYEPDQTSHLSVIDNEYNMVALTQTINSFFGSGIVVPGTGILLNNEMNDFTSGAKGPNSVKPRKRPASNMSPTLVLKDGRPFMTIGMPGASRIITALPQILSNMIDHEMNIQEAIDAPRIHSLSGNELFMESRIPREVRAALGRKGYRLILKKDFDLYFGGAQGVKIDLETGKLHGGADPRREGSVMGY